MVKCWMRVSMHVSGWYVGARLFQRHVHERRGVTSMHTEGNQHVAKIQVHPHRGRSMDGRVHPSRRSHRSNLLGSCWNYVTLRRRGG